MVLTGKMALVTGGAVRIGRAIVQGLAQRGAGVVIHCRTSHDEAQWLARSIVEGGGKAFVVDGDLGDEAGAAAVFEAASERAGPLDILVNNASVFHKTAFIDADASTYEREWRVNAVAPLLLSRRFATQVMAREGEGCIVNLLDRRIATHEAGCLPYLLSKKILEEFTYSGALELAPRIRVNAVAPGAVLPPPGVGQDGFHDLAGAAPLAHACTPAEVADAVAFLVTAESMTGQVLFVDGGQHLVPV